MRSWRPPTKIFIDTAPRTGRRSTSRVFVWIAALLAAAVIGLELLIAYYPVPL